MSAEISSITQKKGHLKANHSHYYCGLVGQGRGMDWEWDTAHLHESREQGSIPEFVPTEHSFPGFHHSFVVPLVHVAHQLPVHVI